MTTKHDRKPCFQGLCAGWVNRGLAFAFAVGAATMAYAADWYVDANNGNDAWDGTTAAIPSQATIDEGGTIAGPRKTLHAMMSDVCVVAGDTVWAAEGDYNERGIANGTETTLNRVQVKGGVMLRASGSRDKTFISGADGTDGAYSAGATRCVFFLPPSDDDSANGYGYGIVKGFTIRNGRTAIDTEYGGGSSGSGLLVECDFQNNGCSDKDRGGTMFYGTALRSRFSSIDSSKGAYIAWTDKNTELVHIISSLIAVSSSSGKRGCFYQRVKVCNSTFLGESFVRKCTAYNCLFIGDGANSASQYEAEHINVLSRSDFNMTYCKTNAECRVVAEAETPYDETTFRPLPGSVAIDAGNSSDSNAEKYNYENLTNGWPTAWLAEAGKDYYGGERVVGGSIDIGCGERQGSSVAILDDSDGLVVEGIQKGESNLSVGSSAEVTFSRTLTSDKLCLGVNINGEFHSFGGTTSDVPYSVTLQGRNDLDYYVTAVYETDQKDWYVNADPEIGNNENKGYHKNCPRRTLDKAMELATENAGHVVHAAAGTYDSFAEGAEYANTSNRVTVKEGVGLVADDWPLQKTFIEGALDTSENADEYNNGPNAIRCVYVKSGGYVRGFILRKGRTVTTGGTGTAGGRCCGGALLEKDAALIDCEVTGNHCAYRGRAVGCPSSTGWLIRCYLHDNGDESTQGYTDVYDRMSLIDTCVIGPKHSSGYYTYYGRGTIINSTILGSGTRPAAATQIYNSYMLSESHATDKIISCWNCAFASRYSDATSSTTQTNGCLFAVDGGDIFDENYRPKTATSVLVDGGNNDYYVFPEQFAQFKENRDFADGQRVYNGKIDIGCGEYDFRPDFAKLLGPRAVISEMGPNVTTNAASDIVVPEGDSIALSVAPRAADRITQYELSYTPDGGSQTVVSEKSTEAFSRTLEGPCTVEELKGYLGFVFQIR